MFLIYKFIKKVKIKKKEKICITKKKFCDTLLCSLTVQSSRICSYKNHVTIEFSLTTIIKKILSSFNDFPLEIEKKLQVFFIRTPLKLNANNIIHKFLF